jgi:hypothetical protein
LEAMVFINRVNVFRGRSDVVKCGRDNTRIYGRICTAD